MRYRIGEISVDGATYHDVIEAVDQAVAGERPQINILAVNPEKKMLVKKDAALCAFFHKAELLIPDGIGIVFAVKLLYGDTIRRVTGVDLMHAICRRAAEKQYSIFLYGATESVNSRAAEKLKLSYPGIVIAGRSHGYQTEGVADSIRQSGADILFVALGSPIQERWLMDNQFNLNVKVRQCIGGTLDTITGDVKRAPRLFRSFGLEWLFRLLKQPTRIKRQFRLLIFARDILGYKFGVSNE